MGVRAYWRRAVAVLGLATLLGGAGACGDDAPPQAPDIDVDLTVSARREGGTLRLEYTLANRTGADVVVFSGIPARDTHDDPRPDPDAVYVTARDDDTVEIAKRVFAPPDGVHPAVEFRVRGRVVESSGQLSERVAVQVPLTARRPYDSAARLADSPQRAVFCLGVAPLSEVPAPPTPSTPPNGATPGGGAADQGPTYAHGAAVARVQRLVCGAPFDL